MWLTSARRFPKPQAGADCARAALSWGISRAHEMARGLSLVMAAFIALTLLGLGWLLANEDKLPPNSLPWRPVALNAAPNWLAHWQLNRLAADSEVCRTALGQTSLRVTPLPDRPLKDGCGFTDVVRAEAGPVAFAPDVTATCALNAALFWYQRQLQQAASTHMRSALVRITQFGTFACRNVNNEAQGNRSEHATANAIDAAAFHFANGKTASVLRDYGKPTPEGRFLAEAHAEACKLFNVVLGPGYNRAHANHFHLDMGHYRMCA